MHELAARTVGEEWLHGDPAADGGAQWTDCNNQAGVGGYYVTATPMNFGTSGNRSFASSTVGHLLRQRGGAPTLGQMVAGGGGTALSKHQHDGATGAASGRAVACFGSTAGMTAAHRTD